MDECSDDLLISLVREDNKEAYNLLFDRYKKIVLKWINNKKGLLRFNKIEVEDIFNDFLSVFDNYIDEYDSNLGRFISYLKVCLDRFIIKKIRSENSNGKKALASALSLDASLNGLDDINYLDTVESKYIISDVSGNYDVADKSDSIKEILSKLSNEELKIITLKSEGKSYKEIGEIVGIPFKRVDYVIYKIRKKLTNC